MITYWEFNTPNCKQLCVTENSFHLDQDILNSMQTKINSNNKRIFNAKNVIADGLRLSLSENKSNVILFNGCNCNCFWICPGLTDMNILNEINFQPKQIKPNESMIIYDYDIIKQNESKFKQNTLLEAHIINISIKKNWGYNLKRKSIENCPCWINLSINLKCFF